MPKYAQVAAIVRAQIADGTLAPGRHVPSGAALARLTGYSVVTCRRALHDLIKDGTLIPGASRKGRPRVPSPATGHEQTLVVAANALSASLAQRRRAAGLTQPRLADLVDVSATSIGHAETGRLWQSRDFWERADKALDAGGELLTQHDAYCAASAVPHGGPASADKATNGALSLAPDAPMQTGAVDFSGVDSALTCITITWADGTVSVVYPPRSPNNEA